MRALTLTQPWAGLVASGVKLVENRPRSIIKREDFGKPFAIHASREIDETVYARIRDIAPRLCTEEGYRAWYWLSRVRSAVIAVATVDRVIFTGPNGELDADDFDALESADQTRWCFGPVVYVLRDVRALQRVGDTSGPGRAAPLASTRLDRGSSHETNRRETANPEKGPVPCRGYQGFWTLPDDVAAKVEAQL